jgi:D-sedoheptulose 7-phosphate isomerase
MSRAELVRASVRDAMEVCRVMLEDETLARSADAVVEAIVGSVNAGGKVLLCGNGGSAADAQHLAAELIGRFCLEREAFPALALSDNIAAMTAVGNDYGYGEVFTRAVRGLGRAGDVLIGISTSGRSQNVVGALAAGRERGLVTVALVGASETPLSAAAEHVLCVPGPSTARIQEGQMLLGHAIFELVERELCQA